MFKKIVLLIFILFFMNFANSEKYNGEDSVLNLSKHYGVEYLNSIKNSTTSGLSGNGVLIRKYAIEIISNPSNIDAQIAYLNTFPSSYLKFTELFQSHDKIKGTSLVDLNYIYVDLLERISYKFPKKGALIYVEISKNACFSADLLNYFRSGLEEFIRHYNKQFEKEKNKLSASEKHNINDFLKAKLYGTVGTCKDRI